MYFIDQIVALYTLKLHIDICQFYVSKAGKKPLDQYFLIWL